MLRCFQALLALRPRPFFNRIPLWKPWVAKRQWSHQSPCLALSIAVSLCLSVSVFVRFCLCLACWLLGSLACWLVAWLLRWLARWLAGFFPCLLACCLACWWLALLLACAGLSGSFGCWLPVWQAGWLICCFALHFLIDSSPCRLPTSVAVLGLLLWRLQVRIFNFLNFLYGASMCRSLAIFVLFAVGCCHRMRPFMRMYGCEGGFSTFHFRFFFLEFFFELLYGATYVHQNIFHEGGLFIAHEKT